MENKTQYRFEGPVCLVTFPKRPNYKITIVVSNILRDKNKNLRIDTSEPGDRISWVTVWVRKQNKDTKAFEEKPIDVKCDSYEQVIKLVEDIMNHHENLMKQIRTLHTKPWLKKRLVAQQVA